MNKRSKVAQSWPTLCDPVDCGLPGSFVHGILQARVLAWVAIYFSRGGPDPGVEPGSPAFHADTLPSEPPDFKGRIIQSFKNKTNKQTP